MFTIRVIGEFSAAHKIEGYPGDCSNLHGHNWKVRLTIKTNELDDLGLSCDFRKAKSILNQVLKELDHKFLNDHPWLKGGNPSSERLAKAIYNNALPLLPPMMILDSVELFESDRSSVEYREN
ncbi:6-carboxytetrahydropterin synthase QueD [bacterium]|nr:6-carboxytetrahydropterin synthase QueD [bacterium]